VVSAATAEKAKAASTELQSIATKVGLADGVAEGAILAAVTSLHSQFASIAEAVGLKADAGADVVLSAVKTIAAKEPAMVELQAAFTEIKTKFDGLSAERAKERATSFVDGAIADGRIGVKPKRDHYIALHQKDASLCETTINALPKIGSANFDHRELVDDADADSRDPHEIALQATAHQKKLAEGGVTIDYATAVRAVTGKKQ
jgi:hypothetical protein